MKTAGVKNYHMELGGKDPVIVLEDADLDLATEKIVQGMVKYAGQRCDAIKLVIAHQDIYDELKERLRTKLAEITAKDLSEEPDAMMGPLIDNESADEIVIVYEDAITKGAHALTTYNREGRYIDPLLVETSQKQLPELEFFEREVFGPLSFILPYQDSEKAVEVANSTRFGLDSSIFGENEAKVHKIANELEFGAVFVNEYPRHGIGYYPFGGVKDSGVGREGIGYSVNQMTTTKSIVKNYKGYGFWEEI
jgi:glyceraldehyde-3-phosphate dehydrogenase [NAD(P)+]